MLDFVLGAAIVGGLYGLSAVALNLQAGAAGLLNFGMVAFFGFGAYAAGIGASHGWPWPYGLVLGLVLASAAGALVGRLGRTLSAEYWAITTLALAELVHLVALNAEGLTGGPQGIDAVPGLLPGLGDGTTHDLGVLALVVALLAVAWWASERLTSAQFGRSLRLLREQPDLAAALGHDVVSSKVRILAISAPLSALAGCLYTHYISYIGPSQLLPLGTFLVWTMMVVGGMGNALGVIAGAFLIQFLFDGSRFIKDVIPMSAGTQASLRVLIIGLALVSFLYLRPGGLFPERLRRVDPAPR